MSVRQAQQEISSEEFTGWLAFYQLEPFGDLVADLRHGVLTRTLANVNRNPKTRPDPYRLNDFIHWGELAGDAEPEPEPILLDDPEAQSKLIMAQIFGIKGAET